MSKKTALTDEELSAMFEGIGDDDDRTDSTLPAAAASNTTAQSQPATTTTTATSSKKVTPTSTEAEEDDPLAELANLAAAPRLSTSSRPQTPSRFGRARSPARKAEAFTPATTASGRSSEEKAAAAMYEPEQKVYRAPPPPHTQPVAQTPSPKAGGGWWGGLSSLASVATAAVSTAQAAVKEIQKNEEAQKWAQEVNKNVGALKGLGLSEIRNRAMPTFTNILHTIAPPISQHERLQVHITHDLIGYPSLDPLVYQTFSRIMAQVEGGDLLVIQRGSESSHRRLSDVAYDGGNNTGWTDGPWWRGSDRARGINAIKGLQEGTKLVRVSAESYSNDFFASHGGVEEATQRATAELSKDNPVRSSDIFLAIQAINHPSPSDLFASSTTSKDAASVDSIVKDEPTQPEDLLTFAVHLYDPVHAISFSSLSQSIPQKWSEWLDAEADTEIEDGVALPSSIIEIIDAGGVDPRSWVAEWIEEVIQTAVGVVAQRYVAKRMGVGEGGIGRGKRREMIVESGGGEAARAGII